MPASLDPSAPLAPMTNAELSAASTPACAAVTPRTEEPVLVSTCELVVVVVVVEDEVDSGLELEVDSAVPGLL